MRGSAKELSGRNPIDEKREGQSFFRERIQEVGNNFMA